MYPTTFQKRLDGVRLTRVDGAARRIAVDSKGNPWVISSIGMIFRRMGNSFRPVPGPAGGVKPLDIAISNSNEVWIVSDTWAEVEILVETPEGPEEFTTMFKALLPRNKTLTTFCYEVRGTYFVPFVKTCDGSEAYEAKCVSFKNEALFSAYVSLTYYPFGKTATKTIRTDTTSLGFQRKIYLPMDADTDKKMTLEIIKTSALDPKSVLLTKAVEISSFDSSCYKVWGTIFSPQAGSCQ